MVEVVGVEVGAELAVEHLQQVTVELRRDSLCVVVGRFEDLGILDEVRAQQQVVVGAEQRCDLAQHAPAAARWEVADRAAEKRYDARPLGGWHAVEMALEVADHAVHAQPRVLVCQLGGAFANDALGDVHGYVALQRAGGAERVEQHARLGGAARAQLDELGGAGEA